jgi:serine/threonine protein kinase/Tol biopolymer transport system component
LERLLTLGTGIQLGGYQILGLLGAGGMGEVYRAHDPRLNRVVAIKVIAEAFTHSPTFRERFRREARILASLSHPNIATVYSVEEDDRLLALTMELVEGQSLSELMRPGGMAVDRLLKIAIQIADAIATAHERGITHRDLKPANVLVASEGRVKVLDFGLAKLAQSSHSDVETALPVSELTKEGHIVGTPMYMSPEQAEGKPVDFRSDIFSFGIILYEMATGVVPFKGESVLSILTAIVRDNPASPVEINPRVPREISRIIRRCLAKDPEDRYQSAKDLRNDLGDLRQELSSGEIAAPYAVGPSRRTRRWTALAAAGALIAMSGWVAGQFWNRSLPAFLPTNIAQLTYDPAVEMGPSLSPDGKWITYARRAGGRSDIFLQAVGGENAINLTKDLDRGAEQPAFSPDGERIAFRAGSQAGGLFTMGRTGELVRRISDDGHHPSWSPDAKWVAYSTARAGDFPSAHPGGAELWIVNVESGEKRRISSADALQPAWSPDNKWVAYWGVDPGTSHRDLWTVSPEGGTPTRVTNDAANDGSPAWSADGRRLYFSSDRGGTLNLWRISINAATGEAVGPAEPVTTPNPNAVHPTLSADGTRLVYASYSWTASVFAATVDPAKLEVIGTPTWVVGGPHLWSGSRISPDGTQIALVRWGHQHHLFIVGRDGGGLRRLTNDPSGVRCPEWSPDSKQIVYTPVVHTDGSLALVDVASGRVTKVPTGNAAAPLGCAAWSPDGRQVVISHGPPADTAIILDVTSTKSSVSPRVLPQPAGGVFIPRSWSPSGEWLAGTIANRVALLSLSTRKYEVVTDRVATGASYVSWLPSGRHVVFLDRANTELLSVDVITKVTKPLLSVAPHLVRGASFTPDGRQLIFSHGPEEGDIWMATLPKDR